ncbi:DUF6660 family protein [Chitinophaga cymbidii]|uniref:DUF6660 family protein n=1 Tax=Chitinophaga cymbidii TaxID=1096750 RepID=UPI00353160E7
MRNAATILSIIMIILSCIPCADQGLSGGSVSPTQNHYSSVQEHSSGHSKHHNDACSPLCVCSCCSVVTFVYQYVSIDILLPESLSSYNCYNNYSYPELSFPIFQPPQLV